MSHGRQESQLSDAQNVRNISPPRKMLRGTALARLQTECGCMQHMATRSMVEPRAHRSRMPPSFNDAPQMHPELPPGSALRFNAAQAPGQGRLSHSRALMDNLQGEMSRLLEWASVGEDNRRANTRLAPTLSAVLGWTRAVPQWNGTRRCVTH